MSIDDSLLPPCINRGAEIVDGFVQCDSDQFSHFGNVEKSACLSCRFVNRPRRQSRGLGDAIHRALDATGIGRVVQFLMPGCNCRNRRGWLNRLLPFGGAAGASIRQCPGMPHREPFARTPTRHLMMYIYPIAQHEVWRWNVDQIRRRLHLFNGKRIVSVMTDGASNTVEDVQAAFCGERIDAWVVGHNDPNRWEMQGLPRMLEYVYSCDPNEITFYCHAKGVQGPAHVTDPLLHEQPRIKWATAMYGACLDDLPFVEKQLETHTFAGAFKRRMIHGAPPFRSSWHFAGTFYWFRNACLFALPNWHHFDHQWYGAETYPGQLVGWGQAAGLFCDHPPVLYLQEAWVGQVDAMWETWKQEHGLCTPA